MATFEKLQLFCRAIHSLSIFLVAVQCYAKHFERQLSPIVEAIMEVYIRRYNEPRAFSSVFNVNLAWK